MINRVTKIILVFSLSMLLIQSMDSSQNTLCASNPEEVVNTNTSSKEEASANLQNNGLTIQQFLTLYLLNTISQPHQNPKREKPLVNKHFKNNTTPKHKVTTTYPKRSKNYKFCKPKR